MDPQTAGWVSIVLLFVLLALRVPIYLMLGVLGLAGFWVLSGSASALKVAGLMPYSTLASFDFAVMPLFILMGHFIYYSGFTTDVYRSARLWFGHIPGGLAQATVVVGAAFGAASGSSFAAAATLSKVCIPDMTAMGVDRRLSYGTVATSASLAQMIPPSVFMVIYGIIAEQSIGKLLIAGLIPGLLAALIYMLTIYILVKRNPKLATMLARKAPWRDRFVSLKSSWGIIAIFAFVMGGIYTGVFTPTEAGAVGAFATFVLALALKKLTFPLLKEALLDVSKSTGMMLLIIGCAFIYGRFLSTTRLPVDLSNILVNLDVSPFVMLSAIMALYIVAGFFLDMITVMLITMPVFIPALTAYGYDLIWFGVLMVHVMGISTITPPFGPLLFMLKATVPDAEFGDIVNGCWPFLIAMIVVLILYMLFPQLSLWLPNLML